MVEQIELIDLGMIDRPFTPDRDLIDPDKIRELADSIRSQGLLQPIIIRPLNGRYEVVAGDRRFLAHKLLGEACIKAIVREMTDDQVFEARAVENDQRENLNPIERAKSYLRLRERFGYSNHEIARKMGRNHQVINKYFKLLDMPPEFKEAVARKEIEMGKALVLSQIDDPEFRKFYFEAAVNNGATEAVCQMWVNDWKKTKAGIGYEDGTGRGDLGPVPEPLPIFQTCVCCIGPVEVSKVKYIPVCPNCESQIRGALKPGKS